MSRVAGNDTAVYFAPDDVAGFGPRLAMGLIDLVVVVVAIVIADLLPWPDVFAPSGRGWFLLFGWPYFAALKATRLGTLGYRLLGFRLVGLDGEAPSLLKTTARFWFVFFWGGIDTFWLLNDDARQTFRDKFAGTYVVRRNAKPVGSARIAYEDYFVFGASIRVAAVHPRHEKNS